MKQVRIHYTIEGEPKVHVNLINETMTVQGFLEKINKTSYTVLIDGAVVESTEDPLYFLITDDQTGKQESEVVLRPKNPKPAHETKPIILTRERSQTLKPIISNPAPKENATSRFGNETFEFLEFVTDINKHLNFDKHLHIERQPMNEVFTTKEDVDNYFKKAKTNIYQKKYEHLKKQIFEKSGIDFDKPMTSQHLEDLKKQKEELIKSNKKEIEDYTKIYDNLTEEQVNNDYKYHKKNYVNDTSKIEELQNEIETINQRIKDFKESKAENKIKAIMSDLENNFKSQSYKLGEKERETRENFRLLAGFTKRFLEHLARETETIEALGESEVSKSLTPKEIALILASLFDLNKNDVYKQSLLCK